ncbi:MAG TPA: hypothetical protein VE057_22470 [Archangium sp.]|nr:hypothetical protein [Archangium sp.]
MKGNVWVEPSGGIVIARFRGEPTETLLKETQERVLVLLQDTTRRKVLYDALEMEPPTVELTLTQQQLSKEIHKMGVRVAILVPNSRMAYLSRLAFGAGNYRVFYNDLGQAISWLSADNQGTGNGPP